MFTEQFIINLHKLDRSNLTERMFCLFKDFCTNFDLKNFVDR